MTPTHPIFAKTSMENSYGFKTIKCKGFLFNP